MARHRAGRRRGRIVVLAAGLAGVLAATWLIVKRDSPAPVARPSATPPPSVAPALYLEPAGPAVEQVKAYEAAGRTADAALIRKIATRPVAAWFADEQVTRAREVTVAAAAAGQMPVLTLYHIPKRDCESHSAGGASSPAAYSAWIASMAAALAGQKAIVILEPDSVAQAVQGCLSNAERNARYALLASTIDTLKQNPGLRVYLDGGNPSWITDATRMSDALKKAGVQRADGFALNVANFETTKSNLAYGTRLSDKLNGAHFVIDTSRNGNGPARKTAGDDHWCNPPGRALGDAPTLSTGHDRVDAYLWIKRPGESDGACGDGAPIAGQWWPEYALELARG